MKRLLLLIVGVILLAPITAKAAELGFDCPKTSTAPGETITCTLYTTTNNLTSFNAKITPLGDTTIENVTGINGWSGSTSDYNNIALTKTVPETGKQNILTVTYRISPTWKKDDPCSIVLTQLASPSEPTPNPTPITPDVPVVTNPDTGANTIPYILIGAGVVVALSAYYLSSKKTKFYKI